MTRREAIDFIKRSKAEYFTYGLEGSDLGMPVEKFDAIQDISRMDDFTWGGSSGQNSEVYECDEFGNLLEHVIEIQRDVKIKQEGYDIILEKGDRIQIIKESEGVEFDLGYVSGTLDLNAKTLTVLFSDDKDDQEADFLADHVNDPVLEDIYDYLGNDGYDNWVVDDRLKGKVDYDHYGNTVTLYLK